MTPGAGLSRGVMIAVIAATASGPAHGQTPEQKQLWETQQAQALVDQKAAAERQSRERAARKADPMAWVRQLDPLSAGGWAFRGVAADGSWALFSTDHQLKRSGKIVTVWLRREFAESQADPDGNRFFSEVDKVQYQCTDEHSRVLTVIYYTENNLRGSQHGEEADAKQTPWSPIVPGTQDESNAQWACAAGRGENGRR